MSSYQPPQPVPRPHYSHGRGSRKPNYQHRAPAGTGLMQHPPTFNPKMALGSAMPHAQTRVLLANQQQVQASQLAYNPQAMSMRPGIFPSPQPNPAVLPYFNLAAQQQQPQQQLMYQPGPTQQPIGLGQPATHMPVNVMQQPMPMTNIRGITQANPPVMYNTQEQADTTVPSQRPRAPKSRSHAIKIVDPNTKTEVKVGEPSEPPNSKETVAEFKNKVQSAVSSTGPLAGTTPEVGEGAQSQHRPNAIITNPDQSPEKVKEVAAPAPVDVKEELKNGDIGGGTVDQSESRLGAKVAEQDDGAARDEELQNTKTGEKLDKEPDKVEVAKDEALSSTSNSSLERSKEVEPAPPTATPTTQPPPPVEKAEVEDVISGTAVAGEEDKQTGEGVDIVSEETGQLEEEKAVQEPQPATTTTEAPSSVEPTPSEGVEIGKEAETGELAAAAAGGESEDKDVVDGVPDASPVPPPESKEEEEPQAVRDNTDDSSSTSVSEPTPNNVEAEKDSKLEEFCTIPVEPESAGDQVDLESSKEKGDGKEPPVKAVEAPPSKPHPIIANLLPDKIKVAPRQIREMSPKTGVDGRTMYDRDFLMFFKNMPVCLEKPDEMHTLISVDIYHTGPVNYPPPMGGSIRDRDRDYFGGGKNERRGGGGSRRGSQPKTISHQPTAEKVELRKADQRWTRPVERMAEKTTEDGVKTEELYRRFQGILNKLTPQKFQALAEQALKLEITTEERLSGCIDKIFTKALEEPNFSIAYANLCKVMSPIKVDVIVEEGKIKCTNFRRMLLTKCQHEFEKDKQDDATLEEMRDKSTKAESEKERQELKEELSLATTRMRKRSLGNIRFIGELFKLSMLSETIMHECITRLLKSTSDEESLECFGKLIMTTGKDLDRPEAKPRIDAYFRRIDEIIKKGKIPSRIKFMLQDVQDLRDNDWIPRARQDKQLKTIDQIRAEAKIEQEKEKEMIQQHQVIGYGRQGGGRGDSRRGSKADVDRGDRKEREKEKVDTLKVAGILSKRKEKGGAVSLGPSFRPPGGGWRKGSAPAPAVPLETSKSAKPSRSSSSGSKRATEGRGPSGKGSGSGPKRSHTIPTPEQEREAALQVASHFMASKDAPSKDAPAHAVRMERKPVTPPPVLDEAAVQRKVTSIIDELVANADLKEAVECVKEFAKEMMDAPKLMSMMVVEGINHTLEKKAEFRASAGRLFSKLVQDKVLTQQKFMEGLNEVLELAEDYSIDIPKFWDYLGEVLAPVMAHSTLNLSLLSGVPPSLVESGMAAKLVAKVLQQCQRVLGSEEEVKALWSQSRLNWETLGKGAEDLAEFLVDQNLGYLRVSLPEAEPAYLKELQQQLASDRSNEEVRDWIKANAMVSSSKFTRHLTTAIVYASVSGSGQASIFNSSLFEKRMELVKIYSLEGQGLEVLYALQVAVSHLSHPPKLLNEMFNLVYNTEVLSEDDFFEWEKNGSELYGRGNALYSVRSFFEWLKSSDSEDMQNAT